MFALFSIRVKHASCAAIVMALLPFTANAEPEKLKFAFFASDREFAYSGVVKPFVDAVNPESKGLIEIAVYPGGALGRTYAQQAQLVLSGVADMAWVHPALTPEQFPDNAVLELPGMFRDAAEASRIFSQLANAGILKGYEDFFVIAAIGSDPVNIHTRTPITSLADLTGKKIRTSSRTEGAVLKALGAEPEVMPINEVANAINAGTIDGATASLEVLTDFGISRFATFHYLLNVGTIPLLIPMNRKKFESLPAGAQEAIRKYSGQWPTKRYIDTVAAYDAEILEKLKSDPRRKVIIPSDQDIAAARAVYDSVATQWAEASPRNGELLKIVKMEIAKMRSTR